MAPMALFSIQKASGRNFDEYINKGLNWFGYANPSNIGMIDEEMGTIWECITPKQIHRKLNSTLNILGIQNDNNYTEVEPIKETWSYNFGWILYTFAGRVENENTNSINSTKSLKIYNFN